jgi:hypothetical protein
VGADTRLQDLAQTEAGGARLLTERALDHLTSVLAALQRTHVDLAADKPRKGFEGVDARRHHVLWQHACAMSAESELDAHAVGGYEQH